MIRVLIVDDEPLARRGVRVCLRNEGDVSILGECSSGQQAVERIQSLGPDVVFFDVKMPGMTGFDVLAQIDQDVRPLIVFLIAYDEFAIPAFDSHAADYVLKPIDDARFNETLKRLRCRIRERAAASAMVASLTKSADREDRSRDVLSLPLPHARTQARPCQPGHKRIDHAAYMIRRNKIVQHYRKQRPLISTFSMDISHKNDALAYARTSSHAV